MQQLNDKEEKKLFFQTFNAPIIQEISVDFVKKRKKQRDYYFLN